MTNILVVGDGAIGLLFSYFLAKHHTVYVLTRKGTVNTRFYRQGNAVSKKINATFISHEQLSQTPKFNIVLFTVKAFAVQQVFTQVKPYLGNNTHIILSHNGMGNIEQLTAQLKEQQTLYFLTTSMAGFKSNPNIVQHTGHGQSVLGGCTPLAVKNSQTLSTVFKAIPQLIISNHIEQLRFEKLLVNIAINPLTAHHNIKNGQLRAPQYSSAIFNLLTEACHIATALKLNIKLIDALERAYKVMSLTAENYSSMHQDVMHNRQTEIVAICGYISEQGKKHNIATPYNDALLVEILAKKSAD
ncbi:2-dehydropantoate 2-reductase [Pseudoalteromonas sp.]|uniref:ketopantoate reductase family protein n=1 Tax=Pseudoalteromonas sp. TaxID=53249 RepID=UPI001BCB4293|nr:2-dehydropantoate 2-reductase [Pseudoalteromonas sp.]